MKAQNKVVFVLLLTALSFLSKAASIGQALGQVTEKETGKPIAFAEIVFENKMDKIELKANEYGYYYADHIPTGKYQVRVQFNNRTFVMNQVRIFDSYSSKVDLVLSRSETLPATVELEQQDPFITAVSSTGITLTENTFNQRTQSLGDVLSTQPGVDIINGRLYIKGSDQVRFFIDGSPVIGQAVIGKAW